MAAIVSALIACGEPRDLREWTPADHQSAPPGAGVPEAAEDDEPPSAGAALFAVHCAICHGAAGRGDGRGAPPMARVPDLTDPVLASRRTDDDVRTLIATGRGFMPGFERSIPDEGIDALVAHVRTLAPVVVAPVIEPAPDGAPPSDDAPSEGEPPEGGDVSPEDTSPEEGE